MPPRKNSWRSFVEVRAFAQSLKLKNGQAWHAWWKKHDRPADIPGDPSRCKAYRYAGDWAGWEDFLGYSFSRTTTKKAWRSFTAVRTFARSLQLKNRDAWKAWWKKHDRPADIPSCPDQVYAEDWAGWEDFLGDSYVDMNKKKKAWRSFVKVRVYAQSLRLKNSGAWKVWWEKHDRPADIPRHPDLTYAEDWAGWEDFLGDSYVNNSSNNKKKAWRSFTVVRTFAHSLKLKNRLAWVAWWKKHDRPADIPYNPNRAYAEDWAGWDDFLGDSYVNTKKTTKKTTRKKKLGKRKRGVRKRASTSESESAAKKKRKRKRKHQHHQRMDTTNIVEGDGRQKSNKPFARV